MASGSFKKNTILLLLGTILNKGAQFIAIPFFSRWLSAAEYGQFDLFYTYVLLMIPIITLSTHEAVFRYGVEENNINSKKSIISGGLILNAINFLLLLIISFPLVKLWGSNVYIWFMLYLLAELFATYLRGYLRAMNRLDIYSFAMLFSTIAMIFAVVVLVYVNQWGLTGMLAGYAIGTMIGDAVICIWSKWILMVVINRGSIKEIKRLVRYAIPLVPNDLSWWIMNASDRQIINVYFSDVANGIYAIAHKIPALCSVMFNMFAISWQQEVVQRIEDKEHNEYFNSVFNRLLVLLLSFCACLLAGSWILYYFIFDEKYFEAIQYSPILIVSSGIMALSQFLGGIQIALKKSKENGITTVTGAICNILIHVFLIRAVGLYAAAISTLIGNLLIFALRLYMLRGYYQIEIFKKAKLMMLLFLYFFVVSFKHDVLIVNVLNLVSSGVVFILINKEFMYKMLKKQG